MRFSESSFAEAVLYVTIFKYSVFIIAPIAVKNFIRALKHSTFGTEPNKNYVLNSQNHGDSTENCVCFVHLKRMNNPHSHESP